MRRVSIIHFLLVLIILIGAINTASADKYVATNGTDWLAINYPNNCNDINWPCKTIQHAINQSAGLYQMIKVATGIYYENISINIKNKTLQLNILGGWHSSFAGQSLDPRLTTINGSRNGSVFNVDSDYSYLRLFISNFTLTRGWKGDGGALSVLSQNNDNTTIYLTQNIIKDNQTDRYGGAIYAKNSGSIQTLHLTKNLITDNATVRAGGGILVESWDSGQSTVSLTNNMIANNAAGRYGGGAFFNSESGDMEVSLINNTITHNNAGSNGGGFNARSVALTGGTLRVDVKNSIVWGNTSSEDIHISGDVSTSSTVVNASYSDLGDVNVVGGIYNKGAGNINANPFFLDYPGGDFHLEMGSPCIDSGISYINGQRIAPFDDFEGDDRDNFCDIGADEWISCSLPLGHADYCRDCGPCDEGEGDCDNDSECQDGLTCPQVSGTDTCQAEPPVCPHPVGHNDYCRDCGPCAEYQGDCDNDSECEAGLSCPQVTGTDICIWRPCPHPVGHDDYCRDCGPCDEGEGDCDNDSECQDGLTCPQVSGTDTCQAEPPVCPHPVGHNDYCRDCGPCAEYQGDCDNDSECEAGLSCPQVTGTDICIWRPCPHPVGHDDYCRDCGPCDEGEGDCDNDSECQDGLTCPQVSGTDTCQAEPPVCPHPVGHNDYCRDCGPCAEYQGDCDNDSECETGLSCPQVTGTDICIWRPCPHPVGHDDYCRDCGPCAEGEGDCDNDGECQGDLTCPQVSGTDTCQAAPSVCPYPVGHDNYCGDCGPCAEGQGDCDNDGECQGDLTCPQVSGTDTCQ